jgi:exonuclease SbcC
MIIKSIHLRNIRSYTDQVISISPGTTLLAGDIGCGKSTILMAIDFAIFGFRKGELSGSDLLRHGCNDGFVQVVLDIDDREVIVRRGLKRGSTIVQDNCILSVNGIRESLTAMELKAKMLEMLGYSQELMRKNRPVFRYTVYTPQEEMKKILLDEDERLEILRKIFGIDKYGIIRNNARMFVTELRSMKREFESYSRDLDDKILEIKAAREGLASNNTRINEITRQISLISRQYEEKSARMSEMREKIEKVRKIQLALARKDSETQSLKSRINDIQDELVNIDSKIQFNMNLMNEIPMADSEEMAVAIQMLEKDRDSMIRNIASIDMEIDKLSSILSKGVCSFCGQAVSNPSSFQATIDQKRTRSTEIGDGIREADQRLDALKKQKSVYDRYMAIKRTIDDLTQWKKGKKEESERSALLLASSLEETGRLRLECIAFDDLESDYRQIETDINLVVREKHDAERVLSKLEQQKDDLDRTIMLLEKEILKKEESKKKAENIASLVSWFDNFLLLMENIEKHVLLTVQKEFDQYFQYWFAILMSDALSVRINEQFSPVIEQNGYETAFENLSGGEKTSVSLAYRLALNKVINIMIENIRTKDLLILDEPTDGFSTDQLDRVRDVINALGLRQIIIVSHEPKIDTYVENVIRIYKEDHRSAVAA